MVNLVKIHYFLSIFPFTNPVLSSGSISKRLASTALHLAKTAAAGDLPKIVASSWGNSDADYDSTPVFGRASRIIFRPRHMGTRVELDESALHRQGALKRDPHENPDASVCPVHQPLNFMLLITTSRWLPKHPVAGKPLGLSIGAD